MHMIYFLYLTNQYLALIYFAAIGFDYAQFTSLEMATELYLLRYYMIICLYFYIIDPTVH